jgi:hypothetical protein
MTTKTALRVVTATRFSSSDYKKLKYFATAKRLNISELLRRLTLDYLDKQLKCQLKKLAFYINHLFKHLLIKQLCIKKLNKFYKRTLLTD